MTFRLLTNNSIEILYLDDCRIADIRSTFKELHRYVYRYNLSADCKRDIFDTRAIGIPR